MRTSADALLLGAVAEEKVVFVAGKLAAGLLAQVVQAGKILAVEHHGEVARRRRERELVFVVGSAGMLVLMGGLEVNKKLQPLNDAGEPIEGLYATGNVQGGRYLVEYPVTVAGISLGTALTFGRLAGQNAAGADIEATTQA